MEWQILKQENNDSQMSEIILRIGWKGNLCYTHMFREYA
jgi:hypothetical protein